MTPLIPSSLRKGMQVSVAVAAAAMLTLTSTPSFAKSPGVKRQVKASIAFDLTATAEAPATAAGEVKIYVSEKWFRTTETIEIAVTGLVAGTYPVTAVLTDSTTVDLGDLVVGGTTTTAAAATLKLSLPSTIDANSIVTVNVNAPAATTPPDTTTPDTTTPDTTTPDTTTPDTTTPDTTTPDPTVPPAPVVLLTGSVTDNTASVRFWAHVPVTAPPASALTETPSPTDDTSTEDEADEVENGKGHGKGHGKGKGKKGKPAKPAKVKPVKGHALAMIRVSEGNVTKNFFQMIAFGAPANATLNIVVNGETVGTVTSTKQGHIKLRSLPETVDINLLDLVTLTDANGVPVMQADF